MTQSSVYLAILKIPTGSITQKVIALACMAIHKLQIKSHIVVVNIAKNVIKMDACPALCILLGICLMEDVNVSIHIGKFYQAKLNMT